MINKILIIGPYRKGLKGGIYEVIRTFNAFYSNKLNIYNTIFFNNVYFNFLIFFLRIPYFLIKAKEFEIFHIHSATSGSFIRKFILANIIKTFYPSKEIIIQVHSGKFIEFFEKNKYYRKIIKQTFDKAVALIFITEKQHLFFSENGFKDKAYLTRNPIIDRESFQRNPDKELNIIFLGKISKEKGVFDLIEAAYDLKDFLIEYNVKIFIAGAGETNLLKNKIKDKNIEQVISYIGWVDHKEKERILRNSNLMVLPSYFEAMPMSILEGMSFGMPIIATNVGAIPNLVGDENGRLISPGDIKALKQSLKYYVLDRNAIETAGNNSYRKSKIYFISNVNQQICSIYKDLNY